MKRSFWWRENLKNLLKFKELAVIEVINGSTILLWQDKWSTQIWKERMPKLYSFTKNNLISVKAALETEEIYISCFTCQFLTLPLISYKEYNKSLKQCNSMRIRTFGNTSRELNFNLQGHTKN